MYYSKQFLWKIFLHIRRFARRSSSVADMSLLFSDGLKIVTDIEGGNVCNVRRTSENSFSLDMKVETPSDFEYPDHHCYWFFFKVVGAKGRQLRFAFLNCDWMRSHWRYYKPLFSYAEDPNSLQGVEWHKIDNTKLTWDSFSFKQHFESDIVWVALRYPYNYSRLKNYLSKIKNSRYVEIENIGDTGQGNSIPAVVVTDGNGRSTQKKGVLVYAREHGVEQDGSWVTEGMIDFLLSKDPVAERIRKSLVFIIVPMISPDSAISGRAVDPHTGKCVVVELAKNPMDSVEASLLHNRVKKLMADGIPLDICLSFHNPHGTEPNFYPGFWPFNDKIRLREGKKLHQTIVKHADGYSKWREVVYNSYSYSVGRFAKDFGCVSILYEINHQSRKGYLSLEKLKGLGTVFLKGIAEYCEL